MSQSSQSARRKLHSPLTLREVLTPVFYFGRQAMLALLVPLLLAVLAASLAQPVYVAQSRLLILLGGDYVFGGDTSGAGQGLSFDRQQIVHAEMEILGARDIRLQALRAVGLERVYPNARAGPEGLSAAAERLDKDLKIENVPQSNVIELTLRNGDPAVAKALLDKIVELYIERRRGVFGRPDAATLAPQRAELAARLSASEQALAAFSDAHAIGDYNQELQSVQQQQGALEAQLQALDQQLASARARAAMLSRKVGQAAPVVELMTDAGRSQQIEDLTKALLELQNRRREAAAKYQDGYPLIAELDRQIATVQSQIRAAPSGQTTLTRRGANPVYQALDTELASAEGEAAGLADGRAKVAQSLGAVKARLAELVDVGAQYRDLARDRAVVEASLQDLSKKAEDASLDSSMARSHANVRIIQAAAVQAHGRSGRLALLGAGLVLGLVAAAAAVMILYALSEVMISPFDVEARMQLPAVVAVPFGRGPDPYAAGGLPRAARLSQNDAYFILRLLGAVTGKDAGVIELIAAGAGAGTSTLAVDLALLAAERKDLRILIIDLEPTPGGEVSTLLAERGGILRPASPDTGLLRLAGTLVQVSQPMGVEGWRLTETAWLKCMEHARKSFDLVVIDAPALETSYTGVAVAPQADLVLAVIEAEQTRAAVANNLVDRIEAVGATVTGVILNKRRFHIPRAIYARL